MSNATKRLLGIIFFNLIPLVGHFVFHWELKELLLLYWWEFVLYGVYICLSYFSLVRRSSAPSSTKVIEVVVFTFIYFFVYGLLILMFSEYLTKLFTKEIAVGMNDFSSILKPFFQTSKWAIIGVLVRYIINYYRHIGKRTYRNYLDFSAYAFKELIFIFFIPLSIFLIISELNVQNVLVIFLIIVVVKTMMEWKFSKMS